MLDLRDLRRLACLVLVLLAAAVPALAEEADDTAWTMIDEAWYELEMAGAKAGWSHMVTETSGELFRTKSDTRMSIGRGASPIEIAIVTEFVETSNNEPVSMASEQKMAQQKTFARWEFGDGTVKEITRQGQTEKTKDHPWPEGDWLTPRGVEKLMEERLEAGATELAFSLLGPESGLNPIRVRSVRKGAEDYDHNGKTVPVTIWETTTSLVPMPSTERIDEEGVLVTQETNMGFGVMVMRLSTREKALDVKPGEVPELMVRTFVEPNRPIEDPYRSTTATLKLRVRDGKMPELPSAGAQRVTFGEDGKSATLVVDMHDNLVASGEDAANAEYLEATTMVDGDDPLVRKLATKATRKTEEDDVAARADAMRAFVNRHISKKSLGTAFATASETAKTRTGDCSEHAVLLCAMLRAEGIPARVASGLVYADQFAGQADIFGWHMWTQALIDGRWVDLDATLPNRYNAAHVLTGASSLATGGLEKDLSSMMMLIGNLEIDVVEVGHDAPGS